MNVFLLEKNGVRDEANFNALIMFQGNLGGGQFKFPLITQIQRMHLGEISASLREDKTATEIRSDRI